jgi:hypothetical protein
LEFVPALFVNQGERLVAVGFAEWSKQVAENILGEFFLVSGKLGKGQALKLFATREFQSVGTMFAARVIQKSQFALFAVEGFE